MRIVFLVILFALSSCRLPTRLDGAYDAGYGSGNVSFVFSPVGRFRYLGDYDSILNPASGNYFVKHDSLFLIYDTMDYPTWRYHAMPLPDSLKDPCRLFRLREYRGGPVANAWVKLVDEGRHTLDSARSDLSGHALMSKLPAGEKPARIVISTDAYEVVSIPVDSIHDRYVDIVMLRPGPCYLPPGIPVGYKAQRAGKKIHLYGAVPDYSFFQSKEGRLRKQEFDLKPVSDKWVKTRKEQ